MKVLIAGCERSGTSAISNLIQLSCGKSFYDDKPNSWLIYPSLYLGHKIIDPKLFIEINRSYLVKVPGFIMIYNHLKKINFYRPFKTVYIVRDPRMVISSMLKLSETQIQGSDLFHYNSWLGIKEKDEISRLAMRWLRYLEEAERLVNLNFDVKIIRYEDFLRNKEEIIRDLCNYLNISYDEDKIKNKLEHQFRNPFSNKIAKTPDIDQNSIQKVEIICKEKMVKYGYLTPSTG